VGFFSWTCAKTNLPILASTSWGDSPDFTDVVLLAEGGKSVLYGTYDGYGRIEVDFRRKPKGFQPYAEFELMEEGLDNELETGAAKMVLAKHYDPSTDTFDSLGRSRHEPGQGHFHEQEFIEQCRASGGFGSYEGYVLAYHRHLPFEMAAALTPEQGRAVFAARKALADAISIERLRQVNAGVDVPAVSTMKVTNDLRVIPVGGMEFFVAAKRDRNPDGSRRELARMNLDGAGRDASVLAAAHAVVDACRPETRTTVAFTRGGETVAEVVHYQTKAREHWYEATANGQTHAFVTPYEVMRHFGIEETRDHFNALYPQKKRKRPVIVELPVPEPEAVPGLN